MVQHFGTLVRGLYQNAYVMLFVLTIHASSSTKTVGASAAQEHWVAHQEVLAASDATGTNHFGEVIAIDQDTIVSGAHYDSLGSAVEKAGGAYVFRRNGDMPGAEWSEFQKLEASDAGPHDWFGRTVAIEGDTIVVGAENSDDSGSYRNGAAYIFERTEDNLWYETQKLLSDDPESFHGFGKSVAISNETMVIGEILAGGSHTGAAHVFIKIGGGWWRRETKLVAPATVSHEEFDRFGSSVDISGDTIVVGAPYGNGRLGYAAVFQRTGGVWDEGIVLNSDTPASGDLFGSSVSIDGDTLVIGKMRVGPGKSSLVFDRDGAGNSWTLTQKLAAMGNPVAIRGNYIISERTIFKRTDGAGGQTWAKEVEIDMRGPTGGNRHVFSVGISEDTAVFGGWGSEDPIGVAKVFSLDTTARALAKDSIRGRADPVNVASSASVLRSGACLGGVALMGLFSFLIWF